MRQLPVATNGGGLEPHLICARRRRWRRVRCASGGTNLFDRVIVAGGGGVAVVVRATLSGFVPAPVVAAPAEPLAPAAAVSGMAVAAVVACAGEWWRGWSGRHVRFCWFARNRGR